jgi:Icc-related predicted phosphoesterase
VKILLFSDIHSDLRALEALMAVEADYYIAAGDLVNWSKGLDAAGTVMQRHQGRLAVIPGNHETEADVAAFCLKFGFQAAHGAALDLGGKRFGLLGYSNITPFNTPGEYAEEEIARRLEALAAPPLDVLICHCPPKDTLLDQAAPGRHFGSQAIREFIARHQPPRFFCGHIHEAAGAEDRLGQSVGRNLGKKGYLLSV